jgi:DNA-directed RNA polymerase specialized sigma24 family protein
MRTIIHIVVCVRLLVCVRRLAYHERMDDTGIERELAEAQAAVTAAKAATQRRRDAVVAAREAGWSKYKIAAVLGVGAPTVDSIIASAERQK